MSRNLGVDVLVNLNDRLTAPLRSMADRVASMGRRMNASLNLKGFGDISGGTRRIVSGMSEVTARSRGAALAMAGYGAAVSALAFKFVGPAAEMERFTVQLTNLEGSSEGAKRAMDWISDFAKRTPLELNDTVSAYARLKAFGVDPMNGSLQALVDTMAATGGGAEQLDGLVMALGQAWTKGKLQSEEALQMLERGVPVWDLLAEKLGVTSAEVQELATKGKLGREEITLLVDALAERNKGASEGMSKTWGGIISNLMDHWSRFQIMVMSSGVFDYLKSRLQVFLDLLDQMAADGRLQAWADRLASVMLSTLQTIWSLGEGALGLWREWEPTITTVVELMGGWQNVLIGIVGLGFAGTLLGIGSALIGVVTGIGQVAVGSATLITRIMRLGGRLTSLLVRPALMLARTALPALISAMAGVRMAIMALGRALLANPIGLAVAAIAGAAYLIWRNWESVSAWFRRLWANIRDIFGGFAQFVKGVFNGDMSGAVAGLERSWDGLKGYYQTLWDGIAGIFRFAWESGIKPITDALGITDAIVAGWNAARDGLALALDAISAKFAAVWAVISPIIDGLKWVSENGSAQINRVTGATKGPISSGYDAVADAGNDVIAPPIPQYAQGGSFSPGLIMVGERGPELRYESRGGFIAHNNALRGLVDLSARAAALAGLAMPVPAAPAMADQIAAAPIAGVGGNRSIRHEPRYNIVINGSGLDPAQLRAAVRAELDAASRRAAADLRGLLHD